MLSSICRPAHRNLLALILALDPKARNVWATLSRIGATDLHPDHMYLKLPDGSYERTIDPAAWNGQVHGLSFCLIRGDDGEWSIHS